MTDHEFYQRLKDLSLPASSFGHLGHLRLAYYCLQRLPLDAAITEVGQVIARFADSLGEADKFHWTLTEALVRLMYLRLAQQPASDLGEFVRANPDFVKNTRALIKRHYSEEALNHPEARRRYIEPDLAPLTATPMASSTVS